MRFSAGPLPTSARAGQGKSAAIGRNSVVTCLVRDGIHMEVSLRGLVTFLARGAGPIPGSPDTGEESVHHARVHAKRIAAALHLFKPSIEREVFRQERKRIKRASEILAGRREEDSIRRMLLCCAAGFEPRERAALEKWFNKRLPGSERKSTQKDLDRARLRMMAALRDWPEAQDSSAKNLFEQGGLRSFQKAKDAFAKARKRGKADDFHRWRIWTKRLLLQFELAGELELGCDSELVGKIEKLQKQLGDLHDLHVAEHWIESAEGGPKKAKRMLERQMRRVSARLRKKVVTRGEKLFRSRWRKRLTLR